METFVVRVFVPAGPERIELTGIVEHPGARRARVFRGPDELIAVVTEELELDRPTGTELATNREEEI